MMTSAVSVRWRMHIVCPYRECCICPVRSHQWIYVYMYPPVYDLAVTESI